MAWNRMSLLRAAQRSWKIAGLERKKIHEFRHTLGTLASKNFNPRMVQAAMRHTSEKSASVYFHPDEEMGPRCAKK
ncbi:MAG: tyrosine-type recombinase/integrase [Planctomycetes bacterium]|nr:tyrosine-type recombinase/integrase [Planctomycetota bacterium]